MAKKRLNNIKSVRLALAELWNDLRNKKIDGILAGKLTYILNTLIKALEVEFQQDKIMPLTDAMHASKDGKLDILSMERETKKLLAGYVELAKEVNKTKKPKGKK